MKHEVIKTDNYLLVVDDSKIKEGDYHVAIRIIKTNGDKAIAFTDQEQLEAIAEIGGAKKIIAHLPLKNAPILKGVPLLPPISRHQEDGIEDLADLEYDIQSASCENDTSDNPFNFSNYLKSGFIKGYNKAKEKHRFTEDDIRKAYMSGKHGGATETHYEFEELIQSLSQPKIPTHFELEMVDFEVDMGLGDECIEYGQYPKTTTNSQGQTEWVGKWIY